MARIRRSIQRKEAYQEQKPRKGKMFTLFSRKSADDIRKAKSLGVGEEDLLRRYRQMVRVIYHEREGG